MNWNNIISLDGSQNNAFEELVCQLADLNFSESGKFIKVGNPDGGVECYIIKKNGDEIGFQAKYFLSTPQKAQFDQLDISIKTALKKHPNLKLYYVAIPIDRADPREDNKKSFKDRWEAWVKKWQDTAKNVYSKEIEIVYWGSHELIKMLKDEKSAGLVKYFFKEIDLSNEWFNDQNDNAIKSLGVRYSPEINVELEICRYFELFSKNSQYLAKIKSDFRKIYNKFCEKFDLLRDIPDELKDEVNLVKNFVSNLNFANFDYDKFEEILRNRKKITSKNELTSTIDDFLNFIREYKTALEIAKNQYLILMGEAGVGKSHLFADIIKHRAKNNQQSILILGQHLIESKDPWAQILNLLGFAKFNKYEFLGALNSKAQANSNKIIIFIDAINEGAGKDFWRNFIISFIEDIKKYEWLSVAFSIRSSYFECMIPKELSEICVIHHEGFSGIEYDAMQVFFDYYKLPHPTIPLLNPEFSNPLFLKLFCKGVSNNKSYQYKSLNFFDVIKLYIDNIERNFIQKYPNCKSLKLTQKVIDVVVSFISQEKHGSIEYEKAFVQVNEKLSPFRVDVDFLDDLISEGLFAKNIFADTEYIYFEYEKLGDYLLANYFIEKLDKDNLKDSFIDNILPYINTHLYHYKGLIEAFSVLIPEKFNGTEIYELLEPDNMVVVDCFLKSLPYRSASIPQSTVERVLKNISNENFSADIFNMLYSCSTILNHPFNAEFMFVYLSKFSMKERDVFFIGILNKIYLDTDMNPIVRLIDWCWSDNDRKYVDDEAIFLAAIALAWLLSTSNRELRDCATKALICILIDRVNLVLELLQKFKNIDEPYIKERLFAVAYGVLVKSADAINFKELGEYIYDEIFNQKEVYPNILLRDYAKNSIEFIIKKGVNLDIKKEKIYPPYNSYFPPLENLPSNDEIESYEDRDKNYHQSRIISSMVTEYGKSGYMYGDFGRYVFEAALRDFECKDSAQSISNYATKNIFEKYDYDGEYFDKAEKDISKITRENLNRYDHKIERIGKKYQWILFYETMARITDNFKMYDGYGNNKKEVKYKGTFNLPYIRNIDPTILLKRFNTDKISNQNFWWDTKCDFAWDMDNDEWIKDENDLSNLGDILECADTNKEKWIALVLDKNFAKSLDMDREVSNAINKNVTLFIRSYILKKRDIDRIIKIIDKRQGLANNSINTLNYYNIFNTEYYDTATLYEHDELECFKEDDVDIANASIEYYWETEFDASKSGNILIHKPSKILYEWLNLRYSKKDMEFLDENDKVTCFNTNIYNKTENILLIKKDKLNSFLRGNDMSIFWVIVGRKMIQTNDYNFIGCLDFDGYAFFDADGKIKEKIYNVFNEK